jgi:hypothetical protein
MKKLTVQIQPEVASDFTPEQVISLLESLPIDTHSDTKVRIDRSDDAGTYINVNFKTSDLVKLWDLIRSAFRLDSSTAQSRPPVIIVCEGDDGWNDYRLLYHFDEGIRVESLSAPRKH